jgi:hypothetical protein
MDIMIITIEAMINKTKNELTKELFYNMIQLIKDEDLQSMRNIGCISRFIFGIDIFFPLTINDYRIILDLEASIGNY